jgi:pentose-5-phosphate-3-epimerase
MDGRFAPRLTFGADVVTACRGSASVPFEAHLMVEEPDRWLAPYAEGGCDTIIVHQEACRHLHRTLLALARRAGADLFVAGSAILGHPTGKGAAVEELRRALGWGAHRVRASGPR